MSKQKVMLNSLTMDRYAYVCGDHLAKSEEFIEKIKQKYVVEEVMRDVYVLESNRGFSKNKMEESYYDDMDEIENIVKNINHNQDWEFSVQSFGKNIEIEHFLKYLAKNVNGKKMYKDKIIYHLNNDFSYNTLHKISLPLIHIIGTTDGKENIGDYREARKKLGKKKNIDNKGRVIENDDNDDDETDNQISINAFVFIKNKKLYELETDIYRG